MEPLVAEPASSVIFRPLFENISVHRIQLRFTTATRPGSDNDQGVYVQLNSADQRFWLYRAMDNYEAGHVDTYDVLSPNVNILKNLQFIKLGVKGSDDWRIRKIELLINDCPTPIFVKDYGVNGLNITLNQPLVITEQQLRQYAGWAYNSTNPHIYILPAYLPKAKLLSMIEASIGNQLSPRTDGLDWGEFGWPFPTRWGPVVEASYKNANTLAIDLDLQRRITGPNPEVDVNFDLVFRCVGNRIQFEVRNITYGTNLPGRVLQWLIDNMGTVLSFALNNPIFAGIASGLLGKFLDYTVNFDPQAGIQQQACRMILVQPNCDIRLR